MDTPIDNLTCAAPANVSRILVVDDDFIVREVVSDILTAQKYLVETAESGAEALAKISGGNANFSLVILDINMPGMNGLELLQQLRDAGRDTPIIMLTGDKDVLTALDAINRGANDYLIKKDDLDQVLSLSVERALDKKRMSDLNRRLVEEVKLKAKELEKLNGFIKGALTKYVAPAYVEIILNNPDQLDLGGDEKEITVMFTDIENFTGISEALPPRELVNLLNEYLDGMTEIVFRHRGTLDKYEGDAIIAFWNAPLDQEGHALKALSAALEMIEYSEAATRRFEKKNQPPLRTRIGINMGKAIVGNIGSKKRFDYTAIGDTVNLAARLEQLNKLYGTSILIAEPVYELAKFDIRFREIDTVCVRGKQKPVRVFEPMGPAGKKCDDAFEVMLVFYYQGLAAYRNREWEAAIEFFSRALDAQKTDTPSEIYLDRCHALLADPPPADWDGVFNLLLNRRKTDPLVPHRK